MAKQSGGAGGNAGGSVPPAPSSAGGVVIGPAQRIIAGGIVFFALVMLADIPATSEIAVAFAYLILLSAALTVGPVAFGRISTLVGG